MIDERLRGGCARVVRVRRLQSTLLFGRNSDVGVTSKNVISQRCITLTRCGIEDSGRTSFQDEVRLRKYGRESVGLQARRTQGCGQIKDTHLQHQQH